MANKKMTYVDAVDYILSKLATHDDAEILIPATETSDAVTTADMVEKFNALKVRLSKTSTASGKPSKNQLENEKYKDAILETLSTAGRAMSIPELSTECPALDGLSGQKVNALLIQLKKAGLVYRVEIKKRAYFTTEAPAPADGEMSIDE